MIPPLEPGATHEHFIGSWPHAALWGPGRYTFEVELNANSAVAESARGNFATSSLTGANHAPGVIVDYCQGCHRSDNRGDGPPPYELVEWEAEEGLDALVDAVIDGPVGMGSKAEVFWLPDSNVHDVVRALLDRGR
jgi:cytochrome c5